MTAALLCFEREGQSNGEPLLFTTGAATRSRETTTGKTPAAINLSDDGWHWKVISD
jgi:hypothetical protein